VLSVRRPEVPAGCVQLGLLPPGTDADPRQPVLLAAAHALVQRLRGVVQVPTTAPDLGEGEQEVRTGVTVQRRLKGLRTQSGQHRGLGVRQPPEAHERPADGVEPADPHGDVVPAARSCSFALQPSASSNDPDRVSQYARLLSTRIWRSMSPSCPASPRTSS
jgi:hypothetical protein